MKREYLEGKREALRQRLYEQAREGNIEPEAYQEDEPL